MSLDSLEVLKNSSHLAIAGYSRGRGNFQSNSATINTTIRPGSPTKATQLRIRCALCPAQFIHAVWIGILFAVACCGRLTGAPAAEFLAHFEMDAQHRVFLCYPCQAWNEYVVETSQDLVNWEPVFQQVVTSVEESRWYAFDKTVAPPSGTSNGPPPAIIPYRFRHFVLRPTRAAGGQNIVWQATWRARIDGADTEWVYEIPPVKIRPVHRLTATAGALFEDSPATTRWFAQAVVIEPPTGTPLSVPATPSPLIYPPSLNADFEMLNMLLASIFPELPSGVTEPPPIPNVAIPNAPPGIAGAFYRVREVSDSDGDGIPNVWELAFSNQGFDPFRADSDFDGFVDTLPAAANVTFPASADGASHPLVDPDNSSSYDAVYLNARSAKIWMGPPQAEHLFYTEARHGWGDEASLGEAGTRHLVRFIMFIIMFINTILYF